MPVVNPKLSARVSGSNPVALGTANTGTSDVAARRDHVHPVRFVPGASNAPVSNGDVTIEATSNTTLTFKLKGSDGTIRSGTITLA